MSLTFNKWHRSTDRILELIDFTPQKIGQVFFDIFTHGFEKSRINHNQKVQISFKLHRGIIHHFIKKGNFVDIITFIKINLNENGFNLLMIRYILLGFLLFPFQLLYNQIRKN